MNFINKNYFFVRGKRIGYLGDVLIVAELGINHQGSLKLAKKMANLAIKNGADVIKNQTHLADEEMSVEAKKIKPGNSKNPIYKIIKENSLSLDDEINLKKYVEKKGAIYMSTPFSIKASNFLNEIGVDLFKIGSGECNNYELIDHVSKFKKPMIISTGMNNINSIKKTVRIIRKNKCPGYALLHTTNLYPTPNKSVRLNCLKILNDNFKDACIGLSDHTKSNFSSYGAITLGGQIIERHFTDTKKRKGPDISCSMDPEELKELKRGSLLIRESLTQGKKEAIKEENVTKKFAFASVVTIKKIKAGSKFTRENIGLKRPGTGYYSSNDYKKILGKKSKKNLEANIQLKKNCIIF